MTFFEFSNIIDYGFLFVLYTMTKKEYILAVIDALPEWEMWWWIKAMVENDQLEERSIDMLVIILKKAMDRITATIKENKMVETIQAMESFDKQKAEQAKEDEKTLQELDSKLNNL